MNLQPFRPKTGEPSRKAIVQAAQADRERRREQGKPLSKFEMDAKIKSLKRRR